MFYLPARRLSSTLSLTKRTKHSRPGGLSTGYSPPGEREKILTIVMKLANMVDLGSAGSNTLQVQVLPIVILI